jgi:hypothetical protein
MQAALSFADEDEELKTGSTSGEQKGARLLLCDGGGPYASL